MSRKIKLSLLFIFTVYQCVFAQEQSELKGKVYDAEGRPIEYAHIYLMNSLIGTVSGEEGFFNLKFEHSISRNDSVRITCVGYHSIQLSVEETLEDSVYCFKLNKSSTFLNDIVVLPSGITPQKIIENTVKYARNNYPKCPFYAEAFYRRTGHIEKNYGRLVEAAIALKLEDFVFDSTRDKIAILEARSSNDYMEQKGFWRAKFETLMDRMMGVSIKNELYQFMKPFGLLRFNKEEIEKYNYYVENIIQKADSSKVYVIKYESKRFEKSNIEASGKVYVNSNDWGIEKINYRFGSEKLKGLPDNNALFEEVTYQQIYGKYYPLLIQHLRIGGESQNTSLKLENGNELTQYHKTTLMVNYIDPKFRKYKKGVKDKIVPFNQQFDPSDYPYNPEFWKNYNMLELNPQDKKMLEELSKEMTLEEQFVKNGKNYE